MRSDQGQLERETGEDIIDTDALGAPQPSRFLSSTWNEGVSSLMFS